MRRRAVAGAVVSAAISGAGFRSGALSRSGAVAALGVGTSIAAGTGWRGTVVLGTFFVSSSALSRIARESDVAAKGSRRDAGQVLANGGVAALAALCGEVVGERRAFALLAGSLAAAAADTWATEIGSTSLTPPRTLVRWEMVAPGTSGGVTTRGFLGAAAGAGLVASVAATLAGTSLMRPFVASVVAGLSGALVDSVLGELVQERCYCPACGKATESRVHRCGTPTVRTGGVPGIDNDVVNLACTVTGALVAAALDDQPMARKA